MENPDGYRESVKRLLKKVRGLSELTIAVDRARSSLLQQREAQRQVIDF
tara:strand:- start:26 stop:172 length:147 start_codon:yes stop_codon:yes gene_type:complete